MRSIVLSLGILCLVLVLVSGAAFSNSRTEDPLGIAVSPQTLLLSQSQGSVSVHTDIPYGSVLLASLDLNGVVPCGTKADARGCLVAKFLENDVKAIVSPPSTVLTLSGVLNSGVAFSGSDTVRVVP